MAENRFNPLDINLFLSDTGKILPTISFSDDIKIRGIPWPQKSAIYFPAQLGLQLGRKSKSWLSVVGLVT